MERGSGPLVSVIVPTYDRPGFLLEAVESVTDQTYDELELLIVDDHSPTPAIETLQEISQKGLRSVRVIRHEENKGANVARNTGMKNANGKYIAFLDDDDKWKATKIERQVTAFQNADENVGVVYTGQRFVNDDGNTTSIHVSNLSGVVTKELLSGGRIAPFSSVMVRSGLLEKAGLLDERFPSWQDREWYMRLSLHCEFKSISEPLVIRRMGSHEQIGDNYEEKRDVTYPLFLEKHRSLASEYGWLCERKMTAALSRNVAKSAVQHGHYDEAREFLITSLIRYPFSFQTLLYLLVALGGEKLHAVASESKRYYEDRRHG